VGRPSTLDADSNEVTKLPPSLSATELAARLGVYRARVIKALVESARVIVNPDDSLDFDTAALAANWLGFRVRRRPET
jgi:hypothetical protein